ncbi:hypothetical protein HMPREF1983_01303 [Gemella bergeri ATCC 700627]|uniref:tRNA(Met) cytidine acetate ligase n=1 Tax=Gemella bergeri ATCC 700627 TaxID=1321820 RepID=U2Q235_9BACL|nr:nucleotidyltransferase family protein [Gemella bergeri]ERK56810.1 hypothetical protein HMPREF1983_01303 [Gemella bergeri ATCC 700627]
MSIRVGIIAEFNPFHNGHKYLIEQAKKYIKNHDGGEIVCVMSEYFTQRGEAAIVDGYSRAEEAVKNGCDMVVALPYVASVAFGDDFAEKSVEILVKMGITHLIFGTEETNMEKFSVLYNKQQKKDIKLKYKELLKQGYSHAKINSLLFDIDKNVPNFILAYSYYKALKKQAPNVKLIPIKRQGQNLNDSNLEKTKFLSATTLRKNIYKKEIENYLSAEMLEKLRNKKNIYLEDFYSFITYQINILGKIGLSNVYDINEGLENRIFNATQISKTYKNLIENIATKRYSNKKIQRNLLHILTNTTKEDYKKYFGTKVFRVLAIKKEKTHLIKEINNKKEIMLVTALNSKNAQYFEHDIKISRLYNLVAEDKDIFKKPVVII